MRVAYIHIRWLGNKLEISHASFTLQLIGSGFRLNLCMPRQYVEELC